MSPRTRGTRRSTQVVPPASDTPEGDQFTEDDELEGEEDAERERLGDLVSLADATYTDYTWHVYRHRSPEDMARSRSRQQTVYVTTLSGPIDLSQLRSAVGGGVFTLWGYLAGKLARKIRFEMEGPPVYFTPPAAPAAPPAPATPSTPNGTDPVLLLLQGQQKTLDAIAAALARPQQPAQTGYSFSEVLKLAELLGGRQASGPDMTDMIALFRQGIEIGGTAVNGNEKGTLEIVLEKGMPVLEKIAVGLAQRRPPARPAAPPRPRPASSATVVEDPVAPSPAAPAVEVPPGITPQERDQALRWEAATGALSRAIAGGVEPDDFAGTLEDLLLPEEVDLMVTSGPELVIGQLRTAADRYPNLNTPEAATFVQRVIAALELSPDHEPAL